MEYFVYKTGVQVSKVYYALRSNGDQYWTPSFKKKATFCLTAARKLARAEKAEFSIVPILG
jgi:hypothetical protein